MKSPLVARRSASGLFGIDLQTRLYLGFATDSKAPVIAVLTTARGARAITETIFEQRFRHVNELRRITAGIANRGRTAWVRGAEHLSGAYVTATEVRAAATLVPAALAAHGETVPGGLNRLDRGHDTESVTHRPVPTLPDAPGETARAYPHRSRRYSTVTDFAKLRGLSMSQPFLRAT